MIEFRDVHKAFGDRPVLEGLSFHVRKGESYVIMGPSGSGKSTTLLHMVGVHRADQGQVLVQGIDVADAGIEELTALRQRIGMVFQGGALLNWLNVYDNVALPLRETRSTPEPEVKERVEEALKLVWLWNDRAKLPSELSGGMRKRVGLARAIVTRPEIILYDEPTAGLDPAMSLQIDHLILDMKRRLGVTSVVVTHDIPCATRVGDRIGIISGGRIDVEGDPGILESRNPCVLRFLGHGSIPGDVR